MQKSRKGLARSGHRKYSSTSEITSDSDNESDDITSGTSKSKRKTKVHLEYDQEAAGEDNHSDNGASRKLDSSQEATGKCDRNYSNNQENLSVSYFSQIRLQLYSFSRKLWLYRLFPNFKPNSTTNRLRSIPRTSASKTNPRTVNIFYTPPPSHYLTPFGGYLDVSLGSTNDSSIQFVNASPSSLLRSSSQTSRKEKVHRLSSEELVIMFCFRFFN